MRINIRHCFLAFCLLFSAPLCALTVEEPIADSAKEQQAQTLFHEIRCMVCQGESVADSPAAVASDVRSLIRTKIKQGATNQEVTDYLVSRYGQGILMTPPIQSSTIALWAGPWILLSLALFTAYRYFSKARS